MSALIGYASSDDEDQVRPEKPAKMAKREVMDVATTESNEASAMEIPDDILATSERKTLGGLPPSKIMPGLSLSPTAGPNSQDMAGVGSPQRTTSTAFSPYTFERQRLQELTMPSVPNFSIPDSPPGPANNSEEAARLAATTQKFERFLELKKQGIHFNDRLQHSTSLRNPSLLPKLMEFAGIDLADSYRSTLPLELCVPSVWPEECYMENLVRRNEKGEKKRLAEREKLDFVPANSEIPKADTVRGPGPGRVADETISKFGKFGR